MSELEPCPFQKPGETHDVRFIELKPGYGQIGCADCGFWFPSEEMISRKNAIERWNTRTERTCHYFPDEWQSAFDENDEEIETGEAYADGCCYSCDVCGYTMLGGDEGGWFEETPGEYGGWNYKPRFDFCPHCGARVVES